MLRIFITAILYLISFFTQGQETSHFDQLVGEVQEFSIEVKVDQITSDKEKVYFALFSSSENFNNRISFKTKEIKAKEGGVSVIFNKVPKGVYAITCFYDQNDNGKMDFSLNGRPLEDYGASNNVMTLGPPSFEDSKFEVMDKDLTFEIKL